MSDASEVKTKDRLKRYQLEQLGQDDELKEVLSSPGGRYLIWRILSRGKLFSTPAIEGPHLLMQTGMRDMALWLYNEVERVDFDALYKMHKEALERESKIND